MDLTIARLGPGQRVYALYRQAARLSRGRPFPHESCVMSKASRAVFQVGPWVFAATVGCTSGGSFDRAITDLLAFVQQALPGVPLPRRILYSPCGHVRIRFEPLSAIVRRARKRHRIRGRWLPDARDRVVLRTVRGIPERRLPPRPRRPRRPRREPAAAPRIR